MKILVLSLSLFSFSLLCKAQESNVIVEISRSNPSAIEVIDKNTKYSIQPNDQQLNDGELHYEISRGKGGQKDQKGVRERNKRYLITSQKDTLAIIQKKSESIIIGNTVVYKKETEDGWNYVNEANDTLYTADLFWNKEKWRYHLKSNTNNEVQETLNKVVLLSLVDMAAKRSNTDCDDDDFLSSLWYILYITSLATN